jgi:hypothetical protein
MIEFWTTVLIFFFLISKNFLKVNIPRQIMAKIIDEWFELDLGLL